MDYVIGFSIVDEIYLTKYYGEDTSASSVE